MAKHFPALSLALCTLAAVGCDVDSAGMNQLDVDDVSEPSPPDEEDAGQAPADGGEVEPMVVIEGSQNPDAGICSVEGVYALRLDANIRWEGSALFDIVPIIAKGAGMVSVDTLVTVTKQDGQLVSTLRACGAHFPDLKAATLGETYSFQIPNETWDRVEARWATKARTSCEDPGCTISTDFLTAQFGLTIPERNAWPGPRDTIPATSTRDDDRDQLPGILMRAFGPREGNYKHPPTSYLLGNRAQEASLAIRIGAALQGTVRSCNNLGGSVPSMILEMRALSCVLDSGAVCDAAQASFLDDNMPVWKVESGTWEATRVQSTASCADVRSVLAKADHP